MDFEVVDRESRTVAIDMDHLRTMPRAHRIANALLASGATVFRTKRGVNAMTVKRDVFMKLRPQLKVIVTDTFDGLVQLTPEQAS